MVPMNTKPFYHNPFFVIIIGILIRLAIAPFTSDSNDFSFWSQTIYGISGGSTLYETYTFWYTPVWGYVLSFLSLIVNIANPFPLEDLFVTLGQGQIRVGQGTIVNPIVIMIVKTPLIISDLAVGLALYSFVKKKTNDEKKSSTCLALWFLSPLVIWVSSVQGQFETICVLFMVLSIILLLDEKYLLAGAALALSVLTKFYPIMLVPVALMYIFSKNRGDFPSFLKKTSIAALGFGVVSAILLYPVIKANELQYAFSFLSSRVSSVYGGNISLFDQLMTVSVSNISLFIPLMIIIILGVSALMLLKKEDNEKFFLEMSAVSLSCFFVWAFAPGWTQYYVILVPMVIFVYIYDERVVRIWVLLSLIPVIVSLCSFYVFYPIAYTGLFTVEEIVSVSWKLDTILLPLKRALILLLWLPPFMLIVNIICRNWNEIRDTLRALKCGGKR